MRLVVKIVIAVAVIGVAYYMFSMFSAPSHADSVSPLAPNGPRPQSEMECLQQGGSGWNSCGGVNYCCGVCNGRKTCANPDGATFDYCACNE